MYIYDEGKNKLLARWNLDCVDRTLRLRNKIKRNGFNNSHHQDSIETSKIAIKIEGSWRIVGETKETQTTHIVFQYTQKMNHAKYCFLQFYQPLLWNIVPLPQEHRQALRLFFWLCLAGFASGSLERYLSKCSIVFLVNSKSCGNPQIQSFCQNPNAFPFFPWQFWAYSQHFWTKRVVLDHPRAWHQRLYDLEWMKSYTYMITCIYKHIQIRMGWYRMMYIYIYTYIYIYHIYIHIYMCVCDPDILYEANSKHLQHCHDWFWGHNSFWLCRNCLIKEARCLYASLVFVHPRHS